MDRFEAFQRLLATPDPPDIHRGHVLTQAGDPRRMETTMPGILLRWLQRRMLEQIDGVVGPATKTKRRRSRKKQVPELSIVRSA